MKLRNITAMKHAKISSQKENNGLLECQVLMVPNKFEFSKDVTKL